MRKLIETARGERVEIEEAYRAHVAACATHKRRPAPFSSFAESLTSFCQANRIRMRATNETVYLLNRRILSSQRDGVLIVHTTKSLRNHAIRLGAALSASRDGILLNDLLPLRTKLLARRNSICACRIIITKHFHEKSLIV